MIKLSILLFLFTTQLLATPAQVVLLTSLETPKIWFHDKDWDVTETVERRFKKSFSKSGYNIKIIHEATAEDLSTQLKNSQNKGVFWVSHSNVVQEVGLGVEVPDLIYTIDKVDVKNIFQKIHPNIKFLAMIGCRGKSLFDKFKAQGFYKNNPNLKLFAFKKKVDPRKGIRTALKASIGVLGQKGNFRISNFRLPNIITNEQQRSYQEHLCQQEKLITLQVKRQSNSGLSAGSLIIDGRFIALLPATKKSLQEQTIQIPVKFFNKTKKKKIIFKKIDASSAQLGLLSFYSSEPISWRFFSKRDGTPIGKNENLYIFKGDKTELFSGSLSCPTFD